MKRVILALLSLLIVLGMLTGCEGEQGPVGEKGDKGDTGAAGIAGEKGDKGDTVYVVSCEITASTGSVDTYTVTFSDGSTATFTVNNSSATVGYVKTEYSQTTGEYKISYTDGTFCSFSIPSDAEVLAKYRFLSDFAGVANNGEPFPGYTGIVKGSDGVAVPEITGKLTVSTVNSMLGGGASNAPTVNVNTINDSIIATADKLSAGSYIKLESNHIMNNKTLTLSFDIDQLSDTDVIRLGHGEMSYGGNYIELTKTKIKVYSYANGATCSDTFDHGLTISKYVNIVIDNSSSNTRGSVTVSTAGGYYENINGFGWQGRNGEIFAVSTASDITNVKMRWSCSAYSSDVWLLGDSYFNGGSEARWTSYLLKAGYTDLLLMGYPGRNSASGLADFKQALKHGTPKYAVWCLGMNNGDSATAINASYLESVTEFLEICEEKGITPILSTTPCTPTVNNSFKNDFVRKSGYRYIDFSRAVGGDEVGSAWYDGMLYKGDNVHPAGPGAKALYAQFLVDFPEISICR